MFKLYESHNGRHIVIGTYEGQAAALAHLEACGIVICGEWEDGCYDAFMADGRILCIEPVKADPH